MAAPNNLPPYNAAQDANQNYSILAVSGTAGTTDTLGTSEPIRVGANPLTGAMFVQDLSGASGTTNIAGTVAVSNVEKGTITKLEGGTVGEVTTVTSITNVAAGTISAVNNLVGGTITKLNGGTLGEVTTITSITNQVAGTLTAVNNLVKGTITKLEGGTLGELTNIVGGSLKTLGTVGVLNAGTITSVAEVVKGTTTLVSTVTSVTNLVAGTVSAVNTIVAGTQNTLGTVGVINAVIAGTGALNLGKAEDDASVSGDVGVQVLAIRDDTLNVRSGAENDYEPFHTDASGALWTHDTGTVISLPNGTITTIVAGTQNTLGTVALLNAGTITAVNTIVAGTQNTLGTVALLNAGTITAVNTIVAGTLNTLGTVALLNAGTITAVNNLVKGTITRLEGGTIQSDDTPVQAPIIQGTLGTAGGSFFGTLSATSGAGTKHYISGLQIVSQSGTPDVRILTGTAIQGTGILAGGAFVPSAGIVREFDPPFVTGTGSELTYHFVSAGTAFIIVNYWKGV